MFQYELLYGREATLHINYTNPILGNPPYGYGLNPSTRHKGTGWTRVTKS